MERVMLELADCYVPVRVRPENLEHFLWKPSDFREETPRKTDRILNQKEADREVNQTYMETGTCYRVAYR